MTDLAIANQLKTLADDYQRRAEKASHVDAACKPAERNIRPGEERIPESSSIT
jgi:hypothetical protein